MNLQNKELRDGVVWKNYSDKLVLSDVEKNDFDLFEIKGVSKDVFISFFVEGEVISSVVEGIKERFQVSEERILKDITCFFRDLEQFELLK